VCVVASGHHARIRVAATLAGELAMMGVAYLDRRRHAEPFQVLTADGIIIFRSEDRDGYELRIVRPIPAGRLHRIRGWLSARASWLRWMTPYRVEMARVALSPEDLARIVTSAMRMGLRIVDAERAERRERAN
jgi:hypothetical protein